MAQGSLFAKAFCNIFQTKDTSHNAPVEVASNSLSKSFGREPMRITPTFKDQTQSPRQSEYMQASVSSPMLIKEHSDDLPQIEDTTNMFRKNSSHMVGELESEQGIQAHLTPPKQRKPLDKEAARVSVIKESRVEVQMQVEESEENGKVTGEELKRDISGYFANGKKMELDFERTQRQLLQAALLRQREATQKEKDLVQKFKEKEVILKRYIEATKTKLATSLKSKNLSQNISQFSEEPHRVPTDNLDVLLGEFQKYTNIVSTLRLQELKEHYNSLNSLKQQNSLLQGLIKDAANTPPSPPAASLPATIPVSPQYKERIQQLLSSISKEKQSYQNLTRKLATSSVRLERSSNLSSTKSEALPEVNVTLSKDPRNTIAMVAVILSLVAALYIFRSV